MSEERNLRKEMIGTVTSDKMDKTITVLVTSKKKHPIYKKYTTYTKKYKAHDEEGKAKVGDIVKIVACKPISKTKRYVLDSIIEEAIIL